MKTELLSDKIFEASMLTRLDQSRELIQDMIDQWNKLDYRSCTSESMLYDLAFNPREMIREGQSMKMADGETLPEEQKQAYIKKLKFKDPHYFLIASAKVQQDAFSERGQGLWLVRDGVVSLNVKEADKITKARSVIAVNDKQAAMGKDIIQIRDLVNSVNEKTYGAMRINLQDLFTRDLRANGEENPAVLNIEVFRRLLSFA